MKRCPKCGELKNDVDFRNAKNRADGLRTWCKRCDNLALLKWQKANPDKCKARRKKYYENNKEEISKRVKPKNHERYEKNKERILALNKEWRIKNKDRMRELLKKWRETNPEKAREKGRADASKRLSTPKGKLNNNIKWRIWHSLHGEKAGRRWESLVGYTLDDLNKHLEKQFKPGMTWDNYGNYWHIDHIIPIAVFNFKTPEDIDFKRCWALENLQPLEAKENMRKNAKFDGDFQPSLPLAI